MRLFKAILVCFAAIMMTASVSFAGSWGYDGQTGVSTPADWGHVSENCNGKSQSPIDIVTADAKEVESVEINFDYEPSSVDYSNNGHAVTAVPNNAKSISVNGEKYTLAQFHFHTLSEHTVNGAHYDMEMHLVHANDAWIAGDTANGKLAVLGVFIKAGDKNKELEEIFAHLPHASHDGHGEVLKAEVTSNYYKLLPAGKRNVYAYQGSLTTPTCNEVVSWFVFDEPIGMSQEQIDHYRALYEEGGAEYHTNRPVQPLNGRTVTYGKVVGIK